MTSDLTSKMTRKTTVESVPPSRTMQETFEYLRDHLHVELASPARGTVAVRLMITNPATRELEVLDEDRVEIGLTEL